MTVNVGDKQVPGHGTPVGPQSHFPENVEPAFAGPEDPEVVSEDDTPSEKSSSKSKSSKSDS